MTIFKNSLSRRLTVMNMLVSGGALLLASVAFFAYDLITFRANLISNTSIQAQIIGSNAVSPLIFDDPKSAQTTLEALRASQHIIYAAVYTTDENFLAGYCRAQTFSPLPLPPLGPGKNEVFQFKNGIFEMEQRIIFQNRPVGFVFIQSDLGVINERFKTYGFILLGILGASLAAALLLSRIAQRKVSEPILSLARTARTVSREKDYFVRAEPTGEYDEVAVLVSAFNDMLQEIQQRELALQESERQFRTLADSIPQLAWMAEPNGTIFWYNRRWYEYTGTTPEEMFSSTWKWEPLHDPQILPEAWKKWQASVRSGEPFEMTFPLRGKDGEFRQFLSLALPVRDETGKIVRWFGSNTDITEQKRSEEALRQTEKLAATGRLAASIAHEINNPLEAVTNLVYLSRIQPANVEKYLKLADQELDRIAQITKNTLGFYRDTASPTKVDISEVLEEVVALYSRKIQFKKIELHPDYGKGIEVSGFPGEIRQIFANLLANAIEAITDDGHLRIRARESNAWDPGGRAPGVRITFLDNGTGIAPEKMGRIFEPFYTTKKDVGTGLGLWLTLGLVAKHNGSLRVRSSVRPGYTWTAFSVFLPKSSTENVVDPPGEHGRESEVPSS